MKVLRKQEVEATNIQVGDQILINLQGYGEFTATAHKITDEGALFIFDDCVESRPMNKDWTNEGGFESSDLCRWMNSELIAAFPDEIRKNIPYLTIPSYGQMFGHDDFYNRYVEPDEDEQLPLMKLRKNRVAYVNNDWDWQWLKNAIKKDVSATHFALVYYSGYAYYGSASASLSVRPAFLLLN